MAHRRAAALSQTLPQTLVLAHAAELRKLIAAVTADWGVQCLAEYTFANLWLFRREHAYRYRAGAWPVVSGLTYDGQRHAMPLFRLSQAPPGVIDALLDEHQCLYPLPAQLVQQLDANKYHWRAQRDDSDYLYPADQFRYYRGSVLGKKRNLVRQLLRQHAVEAVPYSAHWAGQAQAVLAGWMQDKGKAAGAADEQPCLEALQQAQALGLWGYGYCIEGEPVGFVLAESLAAGVYAVRFAKSRSRYKGLAQYMFQHLCLHGPADLAWLNFEQDLGLANFRQTKQSYQPCALLDKWRLFRR
ncbi:DUF2156 domain-containing protein [Lampropedia aestuarii]|uniref:DUF2156 domain-containing protein n=1 Tax=Lampropedia aestuarii TaxID=2562762 RepID=A0A4S5BTJ3_9BURK|nr:DUF2156 domain-containing protein [Lampropedia aestuarii]